MWLKSECHGHLYSFLCINVDNTVPPKSVAPLARASTGRVRVIRVALSRSVRPRPRPGTSESQDGAAGRCAGCTHRKRCDAEAVRTWPARLAGQSITEGGWMGAKVKRRDNLLRVKHHLECAGRSRLSPKYASRATAGVSRYKARPSPSSACLHVPRASSPSGARPYSSIIHFSRLMTVLPGSNALHQPAVSFHAPCRRSRAQSVPSLLSAGRRRLPAFLAGKPWPVLSLVTSTSVLALAAPSPTVNLDRNGLRRRPPTRSCARCWSSGPALRSVRRVAACLPRLANWHWPPLAIRWQHPVPSTAFWPVKQQAACAGQLSAMSVVVAGWASRCLMGRQTRQPSVPTLPVLAHWPLHVSAIKTLAGSRCQQSVLGAGSLAIT